MRILQILEATGGGSRKHVLYIARALVAAGHQVDLVLSPLRADPDFEDDLQEYRDLGCRLEVWDILKLPGLGDIKLLRRLRQLVAETNPDVIHSHCGKAGFLSRVLCKWLGRKGPAVVHTPHSYYFQGFEQPWKQCLAIRLERFLSRTGRLFCISQSETETITTYRIAPATRVEVGMNGLPTDFEDTLLPRAEARTVLGVEGDAVAVVVTARLVARKGHKWLLRAIRAMEPDIRSKAKFLFVGRGPEEENLKQRIAEYELTDVVSCPGYIPHVDRLTRGVDIGVIPSYYEGLSYQLLETMAAGVPLIASDVPGNHFDLPDNPICYAEADDVDGLAGWLNKLIPGPGLRASTGTEGKAWVAENFSLDGQVQLLVACYKRAMGK